MKLFTVCNIILLLFFVEITPAFAVKPANNPAKLETNTTEEAKPKKNKKTTFLKNIKEKINQLFSKEKVQERNIKKAENLETKKHGLALTSLILGILGIPFSLIGFGFLFAVLAIIFGAIALKKIKGSGGFYTGRGMAKAGLILGIIPAALFIILLLIIALVGGF